MGITVLTVLIVGLLGVAGALTFSVKVEGASMEPTLHTGDRLVTNIAGRRDVRRFDLVEARAGDGGTEVVKRVIGMPGDQVAIQPGLVPLVLVRPAGSATVYRVVNPTWAPRIGGKTQGCCTDRGQYVATGQPLRWSRAGAGDYWLIGDNWGRSDDSRVFGFVSADRIPATLNYRISPLSGFGAIANPGITMTPYRGSLPRP